MSHMLQMLAVAQADQRKSYQPAAPFASDKLEMAVTIMSSFIAQYLLEYNLEVAYRQLDTLIPFSPVS
jgi:hypothetical protein